MKQQEDLVIELKLLYLDRDIKWKNLNKVNAKIMELELQISPNVLRNL